jgi:mRNA-degrading endonuclease RelE of RelBE toxin-antitoxin system
MKRVLFRPQAVRDLESLQDRDRALVEEAIDRFAKTGAGDVKLLAGAERHYRLRAGDWRIRFVYETPDIIRVLHIRHRREAYR